jgi:NAD(P)-dependent dehydrogenase (short-subunit alcohol dehydrogenase family)
MSTHNGQPVVVAGASGNVGPFVVRSLLERGATVAAPSRSPDKLRGLREHLGEHADLHTFVGDLGDERGAIAVRERISEEVGTPGAVVATVGDFVATPSLLDTRTDELQQALDAYLLANFVIARTFLPLLKDSGGTYVLLQGPLAFELRPEFDAHLISIATAAQHTLFRALAHELDGTPARVVELVIYAYIRERQTQPSSQLSGEALGDFIADLVLDAGDEIHGRSIHLRSTEELSNGVPA